MNRIALLIGSPSHPNTPNAGKYLSGVTRDIENMFRFLTSSIGGAWQKNEIKVFPPNPKYKDVEPYLIACENIDYAFVYFSGHGFTDMQKNPRVQFNENDLPYVTRDLATRAKHQITIIDACRNFPKYSNFDGKVFLESIDFPNPNTEFAKAVFDKCIADLPNTRVLLFATSEGKASIDTGKKYGGLFSTTMLSVVKEKLKSNNKVLFNIAEIFEIAKINTQKIQPNQIPNIYISDPNAKKLPFALNPYSNTLLQTNTKHLGLNENNTVLIENIAKGALIVGSILLTGYAIGSLLSEKK